MLGFQKLEAILYHIVYSFQKKGIQVQWGARLMPAELLGLPIAVPIPIGHGFKESIGGGSYIFQKDFQKV